MRPDEVTLEVEKDGLELSKSRRIDGYKHVVHHPTADFSGARGWRKSSYRGSLTDTREGRKDILGPLRRGCLAALKTKPGSRRPDQEMLEKRRRRSGPS